jgi:DNA-binding transcriptional ArsR family regulator
MIDLVRLRSFAHVCEAGTVAAAAAGLGYSPPAVSQHVARLERDLGVALFDRVGGRLRPTVTASPSGPWPTASSTWPTSAGSSASPPASRSS